MSNGGHHPETDKSESKPRKKKSDASAKRTTTKEQSGNPERGKPNR